MPGRASLWQWSFSVVVLVLCLSAVGISPTRAQDEGYDYEAMVERVNAGTVRIISGGIGGTYIRIATDLASVLDDGENLRVLPIVGKGSVQNITDLLYLKGIDIAIVQSDVLSFIRRRNIHPNVDQRIAYITKLYNEEFHIVGASNIKTIQDLSGEKVNFGVEGSGTAMTAATVFDSLGIEVQPVYHDQALAIEKIKSGEIAATSYVAGKPAVAVAELQRDAGLRLVTVDYAPELREAYLPAMFTNEDYPNLVAEGEPVDTIAVGAVMAVYNWNPSGERYQKTERFVKAFFANFETFLQPPRHPKWQEVNLAAELPGWRRFPAAQEWLAQNRNTATTELKVAFEQFLQSSGQPAELSEDQKDALFSQFVEWWRARQEDVN
jgi:TRAP transporter TAXI family solute receptor